VSYSAKQVEQFMCLGEPRIKMGLRWDGCEPFFDDAVQSVLMQLHPDRVPYPNDSEKAFPIDAWKAAEQFATWPSDIHWDALRQFFRDAPAWMAELLSAVMRYRPHAPETLRQIQAWRTKRYLEETDKQYSAEERERVLKAMKDPDVAVKPIRLPLPKGKPTQWMDGDRSLSPEAYRQAVNRENRRRDEIMRRWAESWLAHLRIPSVT